MVYSIFRPERSKNGEVQLVADVRIECIEASVHYITTALKRSISQTPEGLFDPNYMKVQYPRKSIIQLLIIS